MISESFTIKNENRLIELQQFIKLNMPTARFNGNPIRYRNGQFDVCITYEIEDINKLNNLFNKFEKEDRKENNKKQLSFFARLANLSKFGK
jgi:hypothetical protein